MRSIRHLLFGLTATLVLLAPLGTSAQQLGGQTQVYLARDESPATVLSHLLGLYGRELVAPGLSSHPVSGRFEVRSIRDVMSYFERAYNISWYELGSTIYVYRPRDWSSERFYVGEYDPSVDWKELLSKAGLYQEKFNVFYSAPNKELLVSGPREYIRTVKSTFSAEKPVEKKKEEEKPEVEPIFMVYPLKYASVEDRTVKLRDSEYTTPGALTVLLNVLGMGGDTGRKGNGSIELSVLADPRTAVDAAGQLVEKSIRGTEPDKSYFGGSVPKLSSTRDTEARASSINKGKSGQAGGSSANGFISADSRTNSIVIKDKPEKYDFYKSIIDQLDIPIAMIEVEAMLVEIDSNTLNQLGVEFGLQTKNLEYGFPATDSLASPKPIVFGSNSIVDPNRFVARLRALATDQNAKVLSRPTIVTQNNVPAFIDLSETLFLQIRGERVAEVVPVTAGSLLQVTPRLVESEGESQIFISVEIQDGALQQSNGDANPSVRNTKLSTQALINRDKAILIGGYNREAVSDIEHKIPLLGSLPFVGKIFSATEKTSQSFARLFLITPRVLSEPTYFAESTRSAVSKVKESFKYRSSALEVPESVNVLKLSPSLGSDQ